MSEPVDIRNDPVLRWVREGIIGRTAQIPTPFGSRRKRYFDQTASGLPFGPIEDIIRERVLPYMGNTHTLASYTGRFMTNLYEEAHDKVRQALNAHDDEDVVVFTGSGATAAINKLIACMGLRIPDTLQTQFGCSTKIHGTARPVVIRSRMEHHSNDLPWRETIAVTEYIGYDEQGRIDWRELDKLLSSPEHRDRPLKIGTFSAASNVTGILADPDELARVMHAHGGYAFFDYAAAAPYVDIDMHPDPADERRKDAVFISVHKFTGGPQTPGVLAANRALFRTRAPAEPGGGTVLYTSPWEYKYLDNIQDREEGGTPPIVQVIRAGLVFDVKERIGTARIEAVERHFIERAIAAWRDNDRIRILGDLEASRIGILSVILDDSRLHYNLAVRLLNDLYGIQVRGGCMCAGTYGHDLLGIDRQRSEEIRSALDNGDIGSKPGWVRCSFSPATSEGEFRVLLDAVPHIARHWRQYAVDYRFDDNTGEWHHAKDSDVRPSLSLADMPDTPGHEVRSAK
jgi:selenocysteine lyase/cysteine desulfurase